MLLHLVNEEIMGLFEVFSQSAAFLFGPVARSVVDFFEDHPKLSTVLQNFCDVFGSQKVEFIEERILPEKAMR
jgi:hypothetical protein